MIYKLKGIIKDYIWGGTKLRTKWNKSAETKLLAESWELSLHPDGLSRIKGGEQDGMTLASVLSDKDLGKLCIAKGYSAKNFPLLIKFIDSKSNLSVQVHPDDIYAHANEFDNGKTEMWYIADCEEGAELYIGFKKEISMDELRAHIENNTLEQILQSIPVLRGESYFIPAGTVHAIGAGITVCEIQQSSNITYRLYDYGRLGADGLPRPLHIEKGIKVSSRATYTNYTQEIINGCTKRLASCEYFSVYECNTEVIGIIKKNNDSFTAVNIVEGNGAVAGMSASPGDTFFIAAGTEDINITGRLKYLLTCLEK